MGTAPQPQPAPVLAKNRIGLTRADYKGLKSTLCPGCGHDAITNHIISAFYDLSVPPWRVAKFSGIGCSSKTPAYFMNQAHGFNAVHGRMPSVATGAVLANGSLVAIGVSGDGDTASIGIGQLVHLIRRNVNVVYIIENNGCYGLTKGQFSATADMGSRQKGGTINEMEPIDVCALAVELGCGYVARSFSGDQRQLVPLIKGALSHAGTAILDVISPCVTFNNHEGSTKSYEHVKEHDIPLHELGFIPHFEPLETVEYEPGTTTQVELPDGSRILLKKLDRDYDARDKYKALEVLNRCRETGELLTGLFYINTSRKDLNGLLDLPDTPLVDLPVSKLRPGPESLAEAMKELM